MCATLSYKEYFIIFSPGDYQNDEVQRYNRISSLACSMLKNPVPKSVCHRSLKVKSFQRFLKQEKYRPFLVGWTENSLDVGIVNTVQKSFRFLPLEKFSIGIIQEGDQNTDVNEKTQSDPSNKNVKTFLEGNPLTISFENLKKGT
ncbi:hypothetical protein RCL_jg12854.t1 [Rhizophagus clarus]|uniref:Uncharacterized protein n=1 Tax=Rhizophagus clarus TaxID=94130 RepID=A0A8H3QDZ6_9GLOM|nr:hypothetical protein RCL_jg12854.t1 [Rhizophagus clarus]